MGKGYYIPKTHQSPGKFNLFISFMFDASRTKIELWQAAFETASKMLFDATDGQMQFGTIKYINKSAGKMEADACLFENPNYQSASGTAGDISKQNSRMLLKRRAADFPFEILHEFGHYGLYLEDEYRLSGSHDGSCTGDAEGENACIMEFGLDGGGYELVSEFCCAENHTFGNNQEVLHHMSCWNRMGEKYDDLVVPSLGSRPESAPPANDPDPIIWKELDSDAKLMILVDIDSIEEKAARVLSNAVRQLQLLLQTTKDVRLIGLEETMVGFNNQPKGQETKDVVFSVIDAFLADDMPVFQSVVFISNRFNLKSEPAKQITDQFRENDLQFHGIELSHSDDLSIHNLARLTGGQSYFAELDDYLLDAVTKTVFGVLNTVEHFSWGVNETHYLSKRSHLLRDLKQPTLGIKVSTDPRQTSVPALIETGATEAVFIVIHPPNDELILSVVQPDGAILRTIRHESQALQTIHITAPQSGRWLLRIHRLTAESSVPLSVMVAIRNSNISPTMELKALGERSYRIRVAVMVEGPITHLEPAVLEIFRIVGVEQSLLAVIPMSHELHGSDPTGFLTTKYKFTKTGRYLLRTRLTNPGTATPNRIHSLGEPFPSEWASTSSIPAFVRELEQTHVFS